jgi:hypothetical protein
MSPSLRSVVLALAIALLGIFPSSAFARMPNIVGDPFVDNASFNGVANTMMYTVTVTVDTTAADVDHTAKVGFTDSYTSCTDTTTVWKWAPPQTFDTTDTRTWTLYNFQPGATYYYKVRVGAGTMHRSVCGQLTTPAAETPWVPDDLAGLDLQYFKSGDEIATRYVIMETGDCSGRARGDGARDYILALDVENESIVWYLDLAAVSGIDGAETSGWRYQPGPSATSGRLVVLIGQESLREWAFDGTELLSYDFAIHGECAGDAGSAGPCVHHDAYRSDVTGRTHVLASAESSIDATGTDWETACGTTSRFVNDGIVTVTRAGTVSSAKYLMTDYDFDPITDAGPNAADVAAGKYACDGLTYTHDFEFGAMDWTHTNSVAASMFGPVEVLDLSLKEWDEVLRFNASTGNQMWTLASDPTRSSFGSLGTDVAGATAAFKGQHDAHEVRANEIMMFDNLGETAGARVLRIAMDYTGFTATIDRSWMLMDENGDPLSCPIEGSGQEVPDAEGDDEEGDHVLANCNDQNTVVELTDWSGATGTPPPLVISLPRRGFCPMGTGPVDRQDIWGWHRSFPAVSIGAF